MFGVLRPRRLRIARSIISLIVEGRSSGVPYQVKGMVCPSAMRFPGARRRDLAYREVIEECAPVGYVAVQQKGRPAFPMHPVRLLFEIQPCLSVATPNDILVRPSFLSQSCFAGADDGLGSIRYL